MLNLSEKKKKNITFSTDINNSAASVEKLGRTQVLSQPQKTNLRQTEPISSALEEPLSIHQAVVRARAKKLHDELRSGDDDKYVSSDVLSNRRVSMLDDEESDTASESSDELSAYDDKHSKDSIKEFIAQSVAVTFNRAVFSTVSPLVSVKKIEGNANGCNADAVYGNPSLNLEMIAKVIKRSPPHERIFFLASVLIADSEKKGYWVRSKDCLKVMDLVNTKNKIREYIYFLRGQQEKQMLVMLDLLDSLDKRAVAGDQFVCESSNAWDKIITAVSDQVIDRRSEESMSNFLMQANAVCQNSEDQTLIADAQAVMQGGLHDVIFWDQEERAPVKTFIQSLPETIQVANSKVGKSDAFQVTTQASVVVTDLADTVQKIKIYKREIIENAPLVEKECQSVREIDNKINKAALPDGYSIGQELPDTELHLFKQNFISMLRSQIDSSELGSNQRIAFARYLLECDNHPLAKERSAYGKFFNPTGYSHNTKSMHEAISVLLKGINDPEALEVKKACLNTTITFKNDEKTSEVERTFSRHWGCF